MFTAHFRLLSHGNQQENYIFLTPNKLFLRNDQKWNFDVAKKKKKKPNKTKQIQKHRPKERKCELL